VYFYVLYSAGAWSSRRTLVTVLRLLITGGVGVAMVVNLANLSPDAVRSLNIEQPASFGVWASIINLLFYLGGIWLGNSEYLRAGQRATMDAQVAQLHASRAQLADQAVRLDRLRIARELHDSVAHHVSLMGVQAAVARRTLEVRTDAEAVPCSVVTALERVETSARDAVEELQSVLVTLRSEDDDGPHASGVLDATSVPSTWTLAQVPALIAQVRASGVDVVLHEEGEPDRDTMGTVELTVYRVLQEALTNVRKHGGPDATVQVRIRHGDQRIELEVVDDGGGVHAAQGGGSEGAGGRSEEDAGGPAAPGISAVPGDGAGPTGAGGRGILGMGERAQAVGGTLSAGPRPEGGFRVLLRVPTRGGVRLEASGARDGREAGRP
jgi:signal transduction histidine kinase